MTQAPKTINLQIAANDKLVEIEKRIQTLKESFGIIIILVVAAMFGLYYPIAIILVLYIGYKLNIDNKEVKRMRETYGF